MTYPKSSHLQPPVRPGRATVARGARPALAATLLVAFASCSDAVRPSAPSASARGAAPGASLAELPVALPSLRDHPAFVRAGGAPFDELEAAELATAAGLAVLERALDDPDEEVRRRALRAVPHLSRPEDALGALARALGAGRLPPAEVADAIEGVLSRARVDREVVDPEGARAAAEALRAVAREGGRGGLAAERASSLARRVAERGGEPPG